MVKNHGERERAELGTYCWGTRDGDTCVDTTGPPLPTKHSIRFHRADRVRVNLGYPAESFSVRRRGGGRFAVRREDESRERWTFKVPARVHRSIGVLMDVYYERDRGDAEFGVRLNLHRHHA